MAHNAGHVLNPPVLETVTEINTFIGNQNYGVCKWARDVSPAARKCVDDCPFPFCVDCDLNSKNPWAKTNYVEQFKRGQLCL